MFVTDENMFSLFMRLACFIQSVFAGLLSAIRFHRDTRPTFAAPLNVCVVAHVATKRLDRSSVILTNH